MHFNARIVGNQLNAYIHSFPVATNQASLAEGLSVNLPLSSVVDIIEKPEVMNTFAFKPSLTYKDQVKILFRRRKSNDLQLFLRLQREAENTTIINLVGYERGKYAAIDSSVSKEDALNELAYLKDILVRHNPNANTKLIMSGLTPMNKQRMIDDTLLVERKQARVSIASLTILGSLAVAEAVIPLYFIVSKSDWTSGLTIFAVNTVTIAGMVYQTFFQKKETKA